MILQQNTSLGLGIYDEIAKRTDGHIYIGVVGPVRTGKSTLVQKFMESVVLPHLEGEGKKLRAVDELPQSGAGRTVTTTEPKFIPEEAAMLRLPGGGEAGVRLVDCVGYMVPSALGYLENEAPRMVRTPWFDTEIPFDEAAEYGTRKVMSDHATLALAVTTDGSISQIPRAEYEGPEQRIVEQLKALGKPFVLLLNSLHPQKAETKALAAELAKRYGVSVMPVSCADLTEADFIPILSELLAAFPVRQVAVHLPTWVRALPSGHPVKTAIYGALKQTVAEFATMRDLVAEPKPDCPQIESLTLTRRQFGEGTADFRLQLAEGLFYEVLSQSAGMQVQSEGDLLRQVTQMADVCRAYEKLRPALEELEATGYGIVTPDIASLSLEEPEIVQQNGKFGVRLRASAPSIHMMRAQIETEISPIVGSERQSEELVNLLMESFREDPISIWQSNIFGTSLHELVNEGLHQKLYRMPTDARLKLQETIERIINEGCGGLVCIIL